MPEKYATWDELNAMNHPSTRSKKQRAKDSQNGKEAKVVQIFRVIEAEGVKVFPDENGVFYATYKTGKGHVETQRTRGSSFKRFVINRFFGATGRSLSSSQLDDAINLAEAKTNEESHDVRVRVAGTPDEIFLDLGDNNWKVVRVTKDGWDVLPYDGESCVFLRPDGMLPLPEPDPSGSLEDLRAFVNGSKEEFVKVCGFILACLHPCGPYPALLISGTQGSAKSTLSRFLIALIDNRKTKLSGLPKGEDDLLVAAQHRHLRYSPLFGPRDDENKVIGPAVL
jgi:hypothetical protein